MGGDSWTPADVPLGEATEAYALRVKVDGVVRREVAVDRPVWEYDAAMRAEDGPGLATVEVAQVSDMYGQGPFQSIVLPSAE